MVSACHIFVPRLAAYVEFDQVNESGHSSFEVCFAECHLHLQESGFSCRSLARRCLLGSDAMGLSQFHRCLRCTEMTAVHRSAMSSWRSCLASAYQWKSQFQLALHSLIVVGPDGLSFSSLPFRSRANWYSHRTDRSWCRLPAVN